MEGWSTSAHAESILANTDSVNSSRARLASTSPARSTSRLRPRSPRHRTPPTAAAEARRLAALADLFPPTERSLLKSVYQDGKTAATLAGSLGLSARTLRRKLARLTTRVSHPAVALIAHERARRETLGHHPDAWPDPMLEVATACLLHGRSLRAAAAALGLSIHAVRTHRAAVLTLAASAPPPPPAPAFTPLVIAPPMP